MSLSATVKATAKAVKLYHLADVTIGRDIWLQDVNRKAEIMCATHTIAVEYVPKDWVDLSKDEGVTSARTGRLVSPVSPLVRNRFQNQLTPAVDLQSTQVPEEDYSLKEEKVKDEPSTSSSSRDGEDTTCAEASSSSIGDATSNAQTESMAAMMQQITSLQEQVQRMTLLNPTARQTHMSVLMD